MAVKMELDPPTFSEALLGYTIITQLEICKLFDIDSGDRFPFSRVSNICGGPRLPQTERIKR